MRHHTVLVLVGAIILASAVAAEDEPVNKRAQSRRIATGSVPFQGHYQERRSGNVPRDRNPGRRPRPSMPAPPYAVQMEPLVQYSQRDPLYHQKNSSNDTLNTIEDEKTQHTSRIDHQAEPSNSIADTISPYENLPQHRYDNPYPVHPHYYKEPEPIIEIIIKESNESLPAPPAPPPVVHQAPKKEPVQVFYIKYKKNPNSYGKDGEDDIIYEAPVPALTPPPTELDSEPAVASVTESSVTQPPPPPPSTTLRTIIHPDSEVYHGSGLKVTFGEPEHEQPDHAIEEQSAPEPSISLPTSQVVAQNRDSSTNHFKRQQQFPLQPETYQTPPPPPQSSGFQQPSHGKAQFPRQSSIQVPPFRPQHTNSFFPPQNSPNSPQSTTHQPPHHSQLNQRNQFSQSSQQLQLQHQLQKTQNQQFSNAQPPTQSPHQRTTFRPHVNNGNTHQSHQQFQQHSQSQQHSQRPSLRQNEKGTKQNYQPIAQGTRQQPQYFQQTQLVNPTNGAPHSQFRSQPIHVQASPTGAFQQQQSSLQQEQKQQNQFAQLQGQRNGITQAHFPEPFQRGNSEEQYKVQLKQQQQYQQLEQQQQQLRLQNHSPQITTNIQQSSHIQQPSSINFPVPIRPKPKSPLQIAFEQQQQQQQLQRLQQQKQQYQTIPDSVLNQPVPHQSHQQLQTNRPIQSFDQQPQQFNFLQQQSNQLKQQLQQHQSQIQQQQQSLVQHQQQQHPQINLSYQDQQNLQNSNRHTSEEIIKAIPQLEQHQIQQSFQQPQVFFNQNQNQQQYSNEQINYHNQKLQKPQSVHSPVNKFSNEQVISTQLPFVSSTVKYTTPNPPKVYTQFISSTSRSNSTPKPTINYSPSPSSTTTEAPAEDEIDLEAQKQQETERKEKEKKQFEQNLAALPLEVPDDIREQLLSSGILGNADIQILDYDKVGDIPIENLPPEALENLYGAGSAPIPVVASLQNSTQAPVEMKVVRYDPSTKEGQAVANAYVKDDATQVDPVILNDSRYNRYLPLKVSGTHFPLPDTSLLLGRIINSVVVLAPVDYDFVHPPEANQDGERGGRSAPVQVQGVRFIAGDILKDLVKDPSSENYHTWLEKEKATPTDRQSVVLLVTSSKDGGDSKDKEIFMYDVNTKTISKLRGELSTAFVDVAESNAQSQDLDGLSSQPEDETVAAASEVHKLKVIAPVYKPQNTKLEGFANRDIDLAMSASEPELQRIEKDSVISFHEQPSIMSGYSKMKEYLPSQ